MAESNAISLPARLEAILYLKGTPVGGDLYAGGFLHAYTQGESLERCGQLGALCAGQIVTQLGARSQVCLKELMAQHLS